MHSAYLLCDLTCITQKETCFLHSDYLIRSTLRVLYTESRVLHQLLDMQYTIDVTWWTLVLSLCFTCDFNASHRSEMNSLFFRLYISSFETAICFFKSITHLLIMSIAQHILKKWAVMISHIIHMWFTCVSLSIFYILTTVNLYCSDWEL